MTCAWHLTRLIVGCLLLGIPSLATPGSEQDPSSGKPKAAQLEASPEAAPILADDVRARIRAARHNLNRQVRRAAFEAVIPAAERLAAQQDGPESSELLAVARLGAGRYREAQDAARRWVSQSPRDWRARHYLGMALTATEDYKAALAPLVRAMELAPAERRNRSVVRSLGFAFEKLHRLEDALAVYRSAGDEASAARVQENMETLASLDKIDHGIVCIDPYDWREEGERLEAELKALEEPSP